MAELRNVDVRQLVALTAVAAEGSFGAAAEVLSFSQAAVSQQVAALERAAGMRLFDRPGGPRGAVLTPAGALLLEHARAILDRLDTAERQLADLAAGVRGHLVVGTFQSASLSLLPLIIADMRREAPDLDIELREHDECEDLVRGLLSDEFDVSFFLGPVEDDRLDITALFDDPFVAVVSVDDRRLRPVRGSRNIRLSDLDGFPLVGQREGDSGQVLIDRGLRARHVAPRYVFRSNDVAAVQAMVAAGIGAAIMPLLAIDTDDPGIRMHGLSPALQPRHICVAVRRDRTLSPAALRMVELAKRHVVDVASDEARTDLSTAAS